MKLAEFIQQNLDPIVAEWEKFADTILPGRDLPPRLLRDHARALLTAVVRDMRTAQSNAEQEAKSKGHGEQDSQADGSSAESHAEERLSYGFSLDEVVSEYRALRASVIRLWMPNVQSADQATLYELIRFNEAIDQAVHDAVARYSSKLDHARDLVLAALGHDLRSPLSAVLHSAQFVLRAESLQAPYVKAVARILTSGQRLQSMISDLLDFTSTRLGDRLPVVPAPMDMAVLCQQIIEEERSFHPDRRLNFEAKGKLAGHWDPGRIGQMLANLIGNAIEHGAADAPISVTAEGSDHEVLISVHNEGPPIPEAERRRIFEPLKRGAAESIKGAALVGRNLGLGLYIAREIALAHKGTLELKSSDEQGTTFIARLPHARPSAEEAGGNSETTLQQ